MLDYLYQKIKLKFSGRKMVKWIIKFSPLFLMTTYPVSILTDIFSFFSLLPQKLKSSRKAHHSMILKSESVLGFLKFNPHSIVIFSSHDHFDLNTTNWFTVKWIIYVISIHM